MISPSDLHGPGPAPNVGKLEGKRGSIRENFAFLLRSRYLLSIAVIVFSYNIFINLVEVLWKDQVRTLYPDPNTYFAYMSKITVITGIVATLMAIFGSGNVIRKCGWTVAAMVTPLVLLITSIGFFGFYLFPDHKMTAMTALIGLSPTAMIVLFGSMQNIISRGAKYSIFDATKELTFIPLNREMRVKGKAAIDGVGSRIGKSSGSVIYQVLFVLCSGLSATAPFVGLILAGVFTGWIICVKSLGRQFKRLTTAEPELEPEEPPVVAAEPEPTAV